MDGDEKRAVPDDSSDNTERSGPGAGTTPAWQLVTVNVDGVPRAAIAAGNHLHSPGFLDPYAGALDVIRQWDRCEPHLKAWVSAEKERIEGVVEQPLQYPNKVLCSGPNFTDHLAEMGESGLGDSWSPYFFLKPPTTSMIGDGDVILVDDPDGDQVDWEGELAVVIGRGGRRIAPADSASHVAGYLVANDISLRGPHRRDTPARPFQWDWLASKGADASLPIGPGVVPRWLVQNPQALAITTRVNGVVRQTGNTADMVVDIDHLIAAASMLVTLEPGDVILTGTPAGVGASSQTFLQAGDHVEVSIEGIGTISNRVEQRP